jgi:hypothetical protein
MTTNLMPRSHNLADRSRIALRHPSQHKKGGFRAPQVQKFENSAKLTLDSGRKSGPSDLVYGRLDLGRMKIFLDIDRQGVEHGTRTSGPTLFEEKDGDGI